VSLFRSCLCATALILVGADALANPYANQVLRTRVVPGPHVQLTYAKVGANLEGMLSDIVGMGSPYGVKQTSWRFGGSYRANTGSGVVGLYSIQRCDCYVPKGPLTYRLTVQAYLAVPEPPNMTLTSTATVSDSFDAAVHPEGWGLDGGRWDEPEPMEIQGLDCTVACVTDEPDASADAPMTTISDAPAVSIDAAGPVAMVDARTSAPEPSNTESQGSKGCSISLRAPSSGLPLLALLAFLAWRRRRG
jgi:MYXO-CTERM domain-containing protein